MRHPDAPTIWQRALVLAVGAVFVAGAIYQGGSARPLVHDLLMGVGMIVTGVLLDEQSLQERRRRILILIAFACVFGGIFLN